MVTSSCQEIIKKALVCIFAISLIHTFALRKTTDTHTHQFPHIVATTNIIGNIIENILQDKGSLSIIIKPSLDPHDYHITHKSIEQLDGHHLIVHNGLHLEGALANNLSKVVDNPNYNVISISSALRSKDILYEKDEASGGPDPHIWFDVGLIIKATKYLSQRIQNIDPANKTYYEENAEAYINELKNLHIYIQQVIQKIPENKRIICMPHNAFRYLAKYGLRTLSFRGISTTAEASLKMRTNLVNTIIDNNISAIFLEISTDNQGMSAIQEDALKRGRKLSRYTILTDSLDSQGQASTYIGMMKYNIDTIHEALTT